ncbi:carboxypeptidase-like regulatory domain-containing protein [Pontibacter cellulosilyticus]|uniref:Carboxypeptidase regulatory-like domain-containing protein n=1 Tax=Pontibacter cellulosilyticus TaxID=1720253 RepID=A0A923N7T0_9BACT|nr:carboxypeptidase-like regulatory domain-containing protein [Pontibacter cellulosilyticus]MBC5994303.1 carboxypeptidase regulatory-like domain-containing protein [Pontibacter cellulosilyticus]
MTKRIWAALFAAVLFSGCEDSMLDPTTEATGIVVDHITNKPLSGVTVTLTEDDDRWVGRSVVIAEQQTDASGKFVFKFEWKDSPYTIKFKKQNYIYSRVTYNELFPNLSPVVTDYELLESLKKKQEFVIDMEPIGQIVLNVAHPQPNGRKLTLKLENMSKKLHSLNFQAFEGTGLTDYKIDATANKYTRYTYTIEENGKSQTKVDSIFVNHITPTPLTITY